MDECYVTLAAHKYAASGPSRFTDGYALLRSVLERAQRVLADNGAPHDFHVCRITDNELSVEMVMGAYKTRRCSQ